MSGKLTILTGASGTGKTTKAQRIKALDPENTVVVDEYGMTTITTYVGLHLAAGRHVVLVLPVKAAEVRHIDVQFATYEEYMTERDDVEETA